MASLAELNSEFALPGLLAFDRHGELPRAQITTPACTATVYLQGAHLTHWQPADQKPVLFLSGQSDFTPGKAIRGGIPICFPWFGARSDGRPGPSHGFARLEPWTLAFAALSGEDLHLTFTLAPTELSRSLGFDGFRLAYELTLGRSLTARLSIANLNARPFEHMEEALHAYFAVGDVREISLSGLESTTYLDKTDDMAARQTPAGPLALTGETDRVFPHTPGPVTIEDRPNRRRIAVEKQNSQTTVVWNPWAELAAKLPDLAGDAWPGFVCVEAANTGADALRLLPAQAHTMELRVSMETLAQEAL